MNGREKEVSSWTVYAVKSCKERKRRDGKEDEDVKMKS
jgi:hypothetical protein